MFIAAAFTAQLYFELAAFTRYLTLNIEIPNVADAKPQTKLCGNKWQ